MPDCLLLITDRDLDDRARGNVVRIRNLLKAFSKLDHHIFIICAGLSSSDDLHAICSEVVVIHDKFFTGGRLSDFSPIKYIDATKAICDRFPPTIAIAEYAWMAVCLEAVPKSAIRLIDTHDILHEHSAQFIANNLDPWIRCTQEEELFLLNKAEIIIAIQLFEEKKLRELLPSKKIVCIPHIGEIRKCSYNDRDNRSVLGFIGSAHSGNRGIIEFVLKCWPLIKNTNHDCKLLIAGPAGHWLKDGTDIQIIPFISDVEEFYRSVKLVICPITMGTGLKIKFVEGLLHGKATVATSAAVAGIPPTHLLPFLVADDWDSFSQQVLQICNDPSVRKQIENDALTYAENHFSYQAAQEKIRAIYTTNY